MALCFSSERFGVDTLRIFIGYFAHHMSIVVNGKETEITSGDKYKKYEVIKYWLFESLVVIKTKMRMRFDDKVRIIQLPNRPEHAAWKNPCNIPNNVKVTTTYWFERVSCQSLINKIFIPNLLIFSLLGKRRLQTSNC